MILFMRGFLSQNTRIVIPRGTHSLWYSTSNLSKSSLLYLALVFRLR